MRAELLLCRVRTGAVKSVGTTTLPLESEIVTSSDAVGHDVHGFLAISEAVAHLDYAHGEGKLSLEINDGVEHYLR